MLKSPIEFNLWRAPLANEFDSWDAYRVNGGYAEGYGNQVALPSPLIPPLEGVRGVFMRTSVGTMRSCCTPLEYHSVATWLP